MDVTQDRRQGQRTIECHLNVAGHRIGFKCFLHALADGERLQIWYWHLGEARQRCDYAVGQCDVPFNTRKMLGLLCGRWILGVEQVIYGSLHDIQGIAQFVGDATCYLPDRCQPFRPLLPSDIFRLIGVLDLGQIQIRSLLRDWIADTKLSRSPCQDFPNAPTRPVRSRESATFVKTWSKPISTCLQPTRQRRRT